MKSNSEIKLQFGEKKLISNEIILIISFLIYIVNFYEIGLYLLFSMIPFIIFYSLGKQKNKIYFITLSILFLFGVVFASIVYYYDFVSIGTVISYIVFPTLIYTLGFNFTYKDYSYRRAYNIVILLVATLNLFIIFSYVRTILEFGDIQNVSQILGDRGFANIWSGKLIQATEITLYLSFSLALLPTILLNDSLLSKKRTLTYKSISLISFINSIFITIQLGSRTALIIVFLSFISVYLFSRKLSIKKIQTPFISLLFLFLFYMLFKLNVFNVKAWWEGTKAYARFQSNGLESGRYDAWLAIIKEMFREPLGGREINISISYVHNLWLDVVYDAGILPFFLLIIFTLISFISIIKFILLKHPVYLKGIIIAICTSFFICFLTEPILQGGEKYYFVIYCFILGIIQGLNRNYSFQINNKT